VAGVPTAIHYPSPVNRQEAYRGYCCGDCTPTADRASDCVVSLPISADLGEDCVNAIVEIMRSMHSRLNQ
jgi:UDP-2-acetamido-2-deoxy-ribo-hexuluronate aminotransferase